MNRSMKHGRRTGFTLIELLVVVAIIALLISILLPSLAAAREQAKRAACAANVKGIAFACLTYAEETKGVLPTFDQTSASTNSVAYVGTQRNTADTVSTGVKIEDTQSNSRVYFKMVLNKATQMKSFLCPSAMAAMDHKYEKTDAMRLGTDNPIYDFSGEVGRPTEMRCLSYSFSNNIVDTSTPAALKGVRTKNTHDPRKAIIADRNPLCNKVVAGTLTDATRNNIAVDGHYEFDMSLPAPDNITDAVVEATPFTGTNPNPNYLATVQVANSRNHARKGQNVAYLDGHAKWSQTPRAGADDDFLWTPSVYDSNVNSFKDVKPSELAGANLGTQKSPPNAVTDSFLVP